MASRTVLPQDFDTFKARIREQTRRARGPSLSQIIEGMARYLVGWRGYFGCCQIPSQTPFDDFPSRGARVGAELLHRTTRSIRMSEAGEQYAVACRRVLTELEEAEINAAGDRSSPRGNLTLTAPEIPGEAILRPILEAFMDAYPAVSARLYLLDRPMKLIDGGIDVALRIACLPDSTLVAIRVGEARRVVVAAPRYLAQHPRIEKPGDLAEHRIIADTHSGVRSWSFPPTRGSAVPRTVCFTPRLVINNARGVVASAVEGRGVARVFWCRLPSRCAKGSSILCSQGTNSRHCQYT